jgi:hypothetical protein
MYYLPWVQVSWWFGITTELQGGLSTFEKELKDQRHVLDNS